MDSDSTPTSHSRLGRLIRRALQGWIRLVYLTIAMAVLALISILLTTTHAYITTPSMYPTIPPGSMAFIQAEPAYHVGEVIEFKANGLLWIHRLVGIRPDGSYITKGDNPQSTPDVFVPELRAADVVGRVSASVPYLGFPELFVHHPQYALQWLRAELGLRGKIALLAIAVGLGILLITRRRKVADPAPVGPEDGGEPHGEPAMAAEAAAS